MLSPMNMIDLVENDSKCPVCFKFGLEYSVCSQSFDDSVEDYFCPSCLSRISIKHHVFFKPEIFILEG